MRIAPSTDILKAIGAQDLKWPILLGEFIDNALDANADKVTIDFSTANTFTVVDNGEGCDDLSVMLTPGRRSQHKTTFSGRYGIGAKDAMLTAAECVSIQSVCKGVLSQIEVNWKDVQESQAWEVAEPDRSPSGSLPTGVVIQLSKLRKKCTGDYPGLADNLGRIYAPAIRDHSFRLEMLLPRGRKLLVSAAPEPFLDHSRTVSEEFSGGRKVEVKMGIITRDEEKKYQGVCLALSKRVISEKTRVGIGNDPTPGLYGFVKLIGPPSAWSPTKNKDGLNSKDVELIHRLIATRFEDIILRAKSEAISIAIGQQNRALCELGDILPKMLKAKRKSPTKNTGTVLPTGTGSPHKRAANVQPGNRFSASALQATRNLQLQAEKRSPDDPIFALEENGVVVLNTSHPAYPLIQDSESVVPVALAFFAGQEMLRPGTQKMLPFEGNQPTEQGNHAVLFSTLLVAYQEAQKKIAKGELQSDIAS